MNRMFVRPAEGLKVRDPQSMQPLPAQGQYVPVDSHWSRRLADGDVVEAEAPAEVEPLAADDIAAEDRPRDAAAEPAIGDIADKDETDGHQL